MVEQNDRGGGRAVSLTAWRRRPRDRRAARPSRHGEHQERPPAGFAATHADLVCLELPKCDTWLPLRWLSFRERCVNNHLTEFVLACGASRLLLAGAGCFLLSPPLRIRINPA